MDHKSPPSSKRPASTASFGFQDVPQDARQGLVNDVFATVAGRYDLMNDLMSAGLHRLWKDELIAMLAPPAATRGFDLVDVAGGTGDITLRFLRVGGTGCRAVLCDISPLMLAVAGRRIAAAGSRERAPLCCVNAEALCFPSRTFDAYTIAFGMRNVTHIERALAEAFRVLKPGGRFAVSDVVVRGRVPDEVRRSMELWIGCVAGALEEESYADKLRCAGFTSIEIEPWRIYSVDDARAFLTEAQLDVERLAPDIEGRFASAAIRAQKLSAQ